MYLLSLHNTCVVVMRYSSLQKCIPLDCMLSVLECGGPLGVVGDMSLLVDVVAVVVGVGLPLVTGVLIGSVVGPYNQHKLKNCELVNACVTPLHKGEGSHHP